MSIERSDESQIKQEPAFVLKEETSFYRILCAVENARFWKTERTAKVAKDAQDAQQMLDELNHFVGFQDASRSVILLDQRATKAVVNPEFERIAASGFTAFMQRFALAAVLVKSSVGALQVHRLGRSTEADMQVFTDVKAVFDFLEAYFTDEDVAN